jgi:DHA2 family multidrug resistance protein
MVVGFIILCINTWQLSGIKGNTPISYIVYLLALRGLAVGLTLQTSYVTALSSMHLDQLPRGSSLLNSTRFVVQAVAVATLATVLVGFLSTDIKAEQVKLQNSQTILTARFGVCETPGVAAQDNLPPGTQASLASLPLSSLQAAKAKIIADLKLACDQSLAGFDAAYKITFFASLGALLLALFLPGWPGKWGGRGSTQAPMPGGH